MRGQRMGVKVLATRLIPNASPGLCAALGVREALRVLALLTTDCDDATYIALDAATKTANVEVAYARSFYAGAANASTRLAGEVIGVLAGATPSEVRSGLNAALSALEDLGFRSANEAGDIVYLAHCVARTGSYLSAQAGVPQGAPLAYLIAPPLEALFGLDAALKAAAVELKQCFTPPSETNFAGGLLTGTESACRAACEAFAQAVEAVADAPQA
ncbi:MAG: ethanolamine utilization microcompartment protein EutL [Oscillospiraceae bacterium]|nr:ethanolamine utilization microcompartment protein EutL [Oscillospiraceae bacterium]